MKKIIFTNVFVIVYLGMFASETFYYSNKQKNIVEIDTTKLNVLFYPSIEDDSIAILLNNTSKTIIPNSNQLKLYKISSIRDIKTELDVLKRNTNIAYVWYNVTTDKNVTLIPTNEILFELNEGFGLDDIISLFKQNSIKIKNVNKYGVVVAQWVLQAV